VTKEEIQSALQLIEHETDTNVKALLLAALVSEEFRAAGFEPVVVGGSAIEFYTDGAYMSGDTDICWKGVRTPTPAEKAAIITKFPGAKGSIRSWQIGGLFIDLLGEVTTYSRTGYSTLDTPCGQIVLQPAEDLIVERMFSASCWTSPNPADEACARKLLSAALSGDVVVDWSAVERISALPAYQCSAAVVRMKQEVANVLTEADTE
jgi:hypothetical protein